jgi:hypothetical protein
MREGLLKLSLIFCLASIFSPGYSQEVPVEEELIPDSVLIDSLRKMDVIYRKNRMKPEIILSSEESVIFLQERYKRQYWHDENDPLRKALGQLIFEASNAPYDSAEYFLTRYPYDSLKISWDKFYIWEPVRLKVPSGQPAVKSIDADKADAGDSQLNQDSLRMASVFTETPSDTVPLSQELKDTTIMVIIDTLNAVTSLKPGFPIRYFNQPYQADSMQVAVNSLLKYLEARDSTIVKFTGSGGLVTPVWLNSTTGKMYRFWLKNEFSDSVTVWIGNPSRDTIGLYLEQGISFKRPVKQNNYADAKINVKEIDNSTLLASQKIVLKQQFWKYRTEASYTLSQAALTNWAKGGENSVSTALDITGYAEYNNKYLKLSSLNFGRIKLGFLASGKDGIRKNLDLIETNSKLNHKAFGKFDFSGILLFKTQLAPGYNYTKVTHGSETKDTAIMVSKFVNPVTLTIGLGLDYKPNKNTSINFSPFSYKGTFVSDPAYFNQEYDSTGIDQTKYGVEKNKKSKNEPGISFIISHVYKPIKTLSIINRLQLFTNYTDNPQNIDIDWEVIASVSLNWYTEVRLNTHLIFDDDTKTPYKDPVFRPDGTEKETARVQFKEMLGFSLVFRF